VKPGRRAAEMAIAPPAPPPEPGRADPIIELCIFRVGDEEYAIDLRRMREILQPLPITPVPRGPAFMEGVVNLRGEVIPVVDVRKRLGLAGPAGPRPKVLVVNVAGRVLGLVVDGVSGVIRLARSAIGPPPPLLAASGSRLFLGVCGAAEGRPGTGVRGGKGPASPRLRLLLNVKALLEADSPERARALRGAGADGT